MRILGAVLLVLGISSTGCSGCGDDEGHTQGKLEAPTTPLDRKRVLVTPVLRHLSEDAGSAEAGAAR
jgi:hypothetical protein